MSTEKILLLLSDTQTAQMLERAALSPAGYQVTHVSDRETAHVLLASELPDLIIMDTQEGEEAALGFASQLLDLHPQLPLVLLPQTHSDALAIRALRLGFVDYLQPPVRVNEVLQAVRRAIQRQKRWEEWAHELRKHNTQSLRQRLSGLETIQDIGRKVTALLDLDSVLKAVVDAAVELTDAEEGSLLLLDENTGELYVRASRNFQEDFVQTFRLPIQDTLAGQVLRTGKPVLINETTPQKIKTAYLIYTLIYVPLIVQERVIGVLEVDNRQSQKPFTNYHLMMVSALADYAAIAVENARLYARSEAEREKLETILTHIEDGVIVLDPDGRLMLVNHTVRSIFNLGDQNLIGKRVTDVFQHPELLEVLSEKQRETACRVEITVEDGRVLNAQVTPIPEVGVAVTMQDITHLKELDRIKSDFVNTVSHDLRSPLTAILGYVELLDRVGPLNEQQQEFVRRVEISVQSITALINDLLDLGRIEAGFDARNEVTPLNAILRYALEGVRSKVAEKDQELVVDIQDSLPQVLGNPVRMRQMISNLVGNAVKYTPPGGKIHVRAQAEGGQIILQVTDTGPGIPAADQPYIFDKFYRGSNISPDVPGTGLGLSIVKSIVENHHGRIWVESTPGHGATFTVVLPAAPAEQ